MNSKNKKQIDILRRRNRRNLLIKELSKYIEVSLDSFLDIDDNEEFCKKVFEKLEIIQDKIILQGKNFKENIDLAKKRLKNDIKDVVFKDSFVRLLFFRDLEIEAVRVNIKEVIANMDELLQIIRFSDGYGDFILVDENLKLGMCVERSEHYYEMCSWGIE